VEENDVEAEIRSHLHVADLRRATTVALTGYGPEILRYLRATLGSADAADDAFSQFCEKLWKSVGQFRGMASFRTFAYKLAWCAAQDQKRDPFRRRARQLESAELSQLVDGIRARTTLSPSDMSARWSKLQASLDAEERSLLVLRVDKRLPWKEVASVMAVDAAALRKRFERLRDRLRELARAEGLRR
jgi:RNA polymerase sigma-70 factor (ECF subfamily)